jgi:hypothetical protein
VHPTCLEQIEYSTLTAIPPTEASAESRLSLLEGDFQSPPHHLAPRLWLGWAALGIGAAGLLLAWLLFATIPQRPDGDATALAQFDAQYAARAWQHNVRSALWLNLSGALFAWGALDRLLWESRKQKAESRIPTAGERHNAKAQRIKDAKGFLGEQHGYTGNDAVLRPSSLIPHPSSRSAFRICFWAALLLAWSGWAWNQSRGWQGELFMEPMLAVPLGEDARPTVAFDRFLVPPAPEGEGRALALRLLVDGRAHDIAATSPYQSRGWTIEPQWYGATVAAPDLAAPLFFGGDGTQTATLLDDSRATIIVDVETLETTSDPPLDSLTARHHAILRARFAPGDALLRVGLALAAAALVLALLARRYNRGIEDVGFKM